MSESIGNLTKLTRENYRFLGWIAVFAVYAYLANERLVDATRQSGSMLTAVIVCLPLALITVTVMLRSISSSRDALPAWGLRLDKQGWYLWSFLAVLTLVITFLYPPITIIPDHLTVCFLNLLNLTSQELILRALLISYLIKTLGTAKKKVFQAIVISAILTALVQMPFLNVTAYNETLGWTFFTGLFFGYMYYYTGSIILFMYFAVLLRSGDLLPNAPQGEIVYPLGLALLVYVILSGASLLVKRQKNIPSPAMPELSVNGQENSYDA